MTGRFDWMDYALCAQVDVGDAFFVEARDNASVAVAKAVCQRCTAKAPCTLWLAGFSDSDDHYGIAGGMSARARRRVRADLLGDVAPPVLVELGPGQRRCELALCGALLVRKPRENATDWGDRRFCGNACAGHHRRLTAADKSRSAA